MYDPVRYIGVLQKGKHNSRLFFQGVTEIVFYTALMDNTEVKGLVVNNEYVIDYLEKATPDQILGATDIVAASMGIG